MILVTGGTGFIGSHTCVALSQAGHDILILDNLCNSRDQRVVDRLEKLCGKRPVFIRAMFATPRCWTRCSPHTTSGR